MFEHIKRRLENTIRELKEIEGDKSIAVPLSQDANGYLDKECPNPDCLFLFKVYAEDWKNIFKDEQVFCPLCRHEAKSDCWWTSTQLKESKEQVVQHVRQRVLNAFSGKSTQYNFIPIPAQDAMTLKIQCSECNSRYSVIGSAFFCPCCGHNSVERTFDEALNKVEIKISNLPVVRKAIEASSKDEAEITCRSLVETALNDCIVAFQRFCEASYTRLNPNEKIPLNVFQRLEDGSKLWKSILGEGYEDWLTSKESERINILFQRRHLLSHREGLVDEMYVKRSSDTTYKLGQRIVVKEHDVTELLNLVKKIVTKIREGIKTFDKIEKANTH